VADNLVANPGSGGATLATDEIGGVHYPRSKQVWGPDNTATDVATGSAALPIQDGGNSITVDGGVSILGTVPVSGTVSVSGTVPVSGTVAVSGTVPVTGSVGVTGSVTTAPPANASTNLTQFAGTGVAVNAGTANAGTLRVVVASDQVVRVDGSGVTQPISGSVGISGGLPAGNNNIGDVDVVTQVGAANIANGQVAVTTTAGGVQVVAARATRRAVTIVNHADTDVYVGTGTVSATNGMLLLGQKGTSVTIASTAAVRAIAAAGSVTVSYLEEFD